MGVVFTDIALQALKNIRKNDAERWRLAIIGKLQSDNVFKDCRRLPRPDGKAVYLYVMQDLHITFEDEPEDRRVWNVTSSARS